MIKRKDFVHQRIVYSFNWNIENHKNKIGIPHNNRDEFRKLGSYFKKVYLGKVPNFIFNTGSYPRISQFKITGLKRGFLPSFSKKLIRNGTIKDVSECSPLPTFAQNVYDIYEKINIDKNPGHEPVLKNILIKDKDAVAIEVPLWKKYNNVYLTGHIDLVKLEKNLIKVIDYKPEGRFLHSLPQVAMYGLLTKRLLKVKNLKCISFNKKHAWEYDPEILLTDIKEFLISQNIQRDWEKFL